MRIFIAGGSGQIGCRLLVRLLERGDHIVLLSRNRDRALAQVVTLAAEHLVGKMPEDWPSADEVDVIQGDPTKAGPWMLNVNGCDAVVNLVGEGIFNKRWSEKFKAVLRDSRLQSTEHLVAAVRQAPRKPSVFVQGTAVGIYGMPGEAELTEASPPGDDFLAKLCVEWEAAARPVESEGVRLVLLRTGVVLDSAGGALTKMLTPFKMFVGGPVGGGQQWVSWIHHEDEVGIILMCLDNPAARGPINATAPQPARNVEMAKAIGAAIGRPSFLPTPAFGIRLGLGEVAQIVLGSQKALPKKALELGYRFKFAEILEAIWDTLGKR